MISVILKNINLKDLLPHEYFRSKKLDFSEAEIQGEFEL